MHAFHINCKLVDGLSTYFDVRADLSCSVQNGRRERKKGKKGKKNKGIKTSNTGNTSLYSNGRGSDKLDISLEFTAQQHVKCLYIHIHRHKRCRR